MATRPTTDRVREALFSILGPLHGARAVDLYAGSGALGFEALSRGAEHVWFIESGKAACQVLRDNADHLQFTSRCTIVQREVQRAGSLLSGLDLVLSDPPWPIALEASDVVARVLRGVLAPGARVVLGHPFRMTLPEQLHGLVKQDTRHWGDSAMSFYEAARPAAQDNATANNDTELESDTALIEHTARTQDTADDGNDVDPDVSDRPSGGPAP
jgi:16S rRNA (guanine(966)-N(2))-methyltransferase RsmD